MRVRPRWAVVALAAASMSWPACGGDEDDTARVQRQQTYERSLQLVTDAQIQALAADSPQRAVLRWWRALQFRDVKTVRQLFSREARRVIGPALPETTFLDLGPSLQPAYPQFDGADIRGDTATVYMRVLRNQLVTPKIVRKTKEHLGLSLVKENGSWRIDDPTFFLHAARDLRRSRLAGERSSARR